MKKKSVVFLSRAKEAESKINSTLMKVALCKSMTERITASMGGEHVSHSRNVTANEDAIIRLTEAREELASLYQQYQELVDEIAAVISQVDDFEYQGILFQHYLQHIPLADIADKSQVSRSHVYKAHRSALEELESLLANK